MILKQLTTANGPTTFHVLKKLELSRPFVMLTLTVDSYADEATFLAGGGVINRQILPMTSPTGAGGIFEDAEAWLVTDTASPFAGGQILPDASDTLDAKRARKVAEMSQACADAILSGFMSSALGDAYSYPAKVNDQANLTGSVVRSMYSTVTADWRTPFWCCDAQGVWEYRLHTAAQIQQVGDDAIAARLKCMSINEQLAAEIMAASADRLATINWPT